MQHFFLLLPLGYLLAIAVPLAVTDFREHRLPNKLTLSAALLTLASLAAASLIGGDWQALSSALVAALATFLIGWFLAARAAIGMGDIKLLISLNAFTGYLSPFLPLISLAVALLAATLINIILLLGRRLSIQSSIALGPYLLLGFFVVVAPSAFEVTAAAWS